MENMPPVIPGPRIDSPPPVYYQTPPVNTARNGLLDDWLIVFCIVGTIAMGLIIINLLGLDWLVYKGSQALQQLQR